MTNYTQEQRTTEWFRDRLGVITGSKLGVLMKSPRTKGETFSQTALTYLHQLAAERALNPDIVNDDQMLEFYLDSVTSQSKAMRFGTEQEENAVALYSSIRNTQVVSVGLCKHNDLQYLASSPDGVVTEGDTRGCIEVKCPSLSTFAQYVCGITDGDSLLKVNPDYYYQCQSHMLCTGGTFCDFIVYCPFVINPIHIVRVERNEDACNAIVERAQLAEQQINEYLQLLKTA